MKREKRKGVPVWEYLANGKRRKRWLTRDHVCTTGKGGCLRMDGRFSYCARYSYAAGEDGR